MKIGVIIAMDVEYRQMHDAIGGDTGRLGNNEIVLWQCGIGKVNAALGQVQGLPARYDADQHMLDTALEVAKNFDGHLVTGLICTGDQFVTDRERQNTIKRNFVDGLACDMESAAIAQTCYLMKVPFLSLRVISDTPGRTDNHQQQWKDFLGSMCNESFRFVKKYLETID